MATAEHRRVNGPPTPFTDEQKCAILARGVSVALSAGAGCGKTFVLTERYLAELEPADDGAPPCELGQLIAITFTDRAAREMRDRIRAKCFERLQRAAPAHGEYWLQLFRSLDSARVSTIHAFCASLLRSHAVEAELDPRFAVLEAAQAETLLAELVDDLLREKLAARDADVLELVVVYGLSRLRDALADLRERAHGRNLSAWLAKSPAEIVSGWREYHAARVIPQLLREFAESPPIAEVLRMLRDCTFAGTKMRGRRDALLALLPGIATSQNAAADLAQVRENAMVSGATKADKSNAEVYDAYRDAAKVARDQIDKLLRSIEFDPEQAQTSAQLGLALLKLAAELDTAYQRTKDERAVLDFDDLLLRARRLLVDPRHNAVRQRLANDTRLLLVDECQDTDPVQVELIKALCGDDYQAGKLFFVGDFKQSIYRFRGADPRVFRQLQGETPAAGQLPLSENFRSQPAILHFVNALFYEALSGEGSGGEGSGGEGSGGEGSGGEGSREAKLRYEPLVPHREQTYGGPAVEFMWCVADQKDQANQADADAEPATSDDRTDEAARDATSTEVLRRREADWIARRIRQFLAPGSTDANGPTDSAPALTVCDKSSKQPRPVCQGDIAILFRSLSDVSHYEEALRNHRIDYYLVGGHAFYAQQEIYDVLNLLRSLVSTADEVSLAGVLRSPFFSLADETLFWLARHESGLWAGLRAEPLHAEIDADQQDRVKFAGRVLEDLRACKDRVPVAALVNEALNRTGYDAALLAEFLGERKLANLRKLIGQARALDRTGVMGLADFIVQLSQFVVRQPREPLAATHPEATDVVRLMTIHQAKGLEFPLVFVPDLDRQANDRLDDADYSDELGPLLRLPQEHERSRAVNGHSLHAKLSAREDALESIRLFYVAATRAADFLVLSSGVKDPDKPRGRWLRLLAKRFELTSGRLTASLPPAYAKPHVRVVMEPPTVDHARPSGHRRVDLEKVLAEIEIAAAAHDGCGESPADPIPCDASARRRFSISRLRAALDDGRHTSDAGESIESSAAGSNWPGETSPVRDAIALGKLVHAALATVDIHNRKKVAFQVMLHADKLKVRDAVTREEALRLVEKFLDSPRAAALGKARNAHRETEFLLTWPPAARKAMPQGREAATVGGRYLQGYLDCLYQDEAGRWFVLDYKTSQVSARTLPKLVAAYEMQMLAYGLAAEEALGEPVAGLVLHFLRTGDEHTFAWDQAARRRAAELLDRAIEAQCRSGIGPAVQVTTAAAPTSTAAAPTKTAQIDLELIG